jgi:hypothetical protein
MLRRPLDEARSGLDARRPALQMETQWHANTPMPTIMQNCLACKRNNMFN